MYGTQEHKTGRARGRSGCYAVGSTPWPVRRSPADAVPPIRQIVLLVLFVGGPLVTYWVFAPLRWGREAAWRDLGTHRLAVGSVVVVLLGAALLTASAAPLLRTLRSGGFDVLAFLVAALSTQIPMLLVVYLRLVVPGALSWQELGLRPLPVGRVLRQGLASGVLGLIVVAVVGTLLSSVGVRQNQLEQFEFVRGATPLGFLLILVVGAGLAPFVEELFFRGFIFGAYRRRQPAWVAYGASSLLFAILHANPLAMDLSQMAGLVVAVVALGLVLAWTYQRTGSLFPGMLAHALNNTLVLALLYAAR